MFCRGPAAGKLRPMLRLFESAIDSIISTRRDRIANDPEGAPRDILTFLLGAADPETGEALTEAEIRANILTFIAAGHETTANCISWSLFLLSKSDLWRERVRAEADRVFEGPLDGLADRLVETRAVIDEANRLYPPISAISRAAKGPDELAGEPIKRGNDGGHCALRPAPSPRFVGKAHDVRSKSVSRRFPAGDRSLCLSSFRRGAADLHRCDLRNSGSVHYRRLDRAPFHARDGAWAHCMARIESDFTAAGRLADDTTPTLTQAVYCQIIEFERTKDRTVPSTYQE